MKIHQAILTIDGQRNLLTFANKPSFADIKKEAIANGVTLDYESWEDLERQGWVKGVSLDRLETEVPTPEVTFVVEACGDWYMVRDRAPVKQSYVEDADWIDVAQGLYHVGIRSLFILYVEAGSLEDSEGGISDFEVLELRLESDPSFLVGREPLTAESLGLSVSV